MTIDRRTVLRNLGLFSAAQALSPLAPAIAQTAGKRTQISRTPRPPKIKVALPTGPYIRVLFEGPWLMYQAADGGFKALAAMDNDHVCQLGVWNSGALVSPVDGTSPPLALGTSVSVAGSVTARPTPAPLYADVVGKTFKDNLAPYLSNTVYSVSPSATDVQVSLPVPDVVILGGQYRKASIFNDGGDIATQLYIATILRYNQSGQTVPQLTLNLTGASPSQITVNVNTDLIFRMNHSMHPAPRDGGLGHVKCAFSALKQRVSKSGGSAELDMDITALDVILNQNPDGISDSELGLTTRMAPAGKIVPLYTTLANCAGSGLGTGP